MGRPSKDLHVVIGVLLLQQLHDLSDAETVEALAFNMAWHYALDVRSEADSYFCIAPGCLDTSLSHAAGLSDIAVCHA